MKKVPLSSVTPGMTVWYECYSEKGDLLLMPGTIVTAKHIEYFYKRNFLDLYMLVPAEKKQKPQEQEPEKARTKITIPKEPSPPPVQKRDTGILIVNELGQEFERIRQERLERLLKSPAARQLDLSIRRGRQLDRPVGVGLINSIRQATEIARSPQYKAEVRSAYTNLKEVLQDFVESLLRGRSVDIAPVRRSAEQLTRLFIDDPDIALSLVGLKSEGDDYLFGHMLNVCILSLGIAAAAGYNKEQVLTIAVGALLHDIGMPLVPKEIRDKKEKLNPREFAEIQKHPVMGILMLEKIRHLPDSVRYILYQSHERENGSGYPQHRNSRLIHRYAKIIQIADVYEALTSPRTHRSAYSPFESMEMIVRMTQRGLLSHHFIKSFLAFTSLFPIGSIVELSDHRLARVVHGNSQYFHRPVVCVIRSEKNKILNESECYHIDLAYDESLSIIRAFAPDEFGQIDIMQGF